MPIQAVWLLLDIGFHRTFLKCNPAFTFIPAIGFKFSVSGPPDRTETR